MAQDRLKNILKSEVNNALNSFSKVLKDFDKYLEDIEKQYEKKGNFKYEHEYDPNTSNNRFDQSETNKEQKDENRNPMPTMNPEDQYYAALELDRSASYDQIKKAYRALMKKYHPDFYQKDMEQQEAAKEVSRQVNEAYFYLKKKFNKS